MAGYTFSAPRAPSVSNLTFGGGGSSASSTPFLGSSSSSGGGLSQTQLLQIKQLLAEKGKHQSIGDEILHGVKYGFKPVEAALNLTMRPFWGSVGLAHGTAQGGLGEGLHELSQGLQGKQTLDYGQWIGDHIHNKWARLAIGTGLDIALDPTNLLLLASVPVTDGATTPLLAARLAAKAGEDSIKGYDAIKAAHGLGAAQSASMKSLEALRAVQDMPNFTARSALAELQHKLLTEEMDPRYTRGLYHSLLRQARAESVMEVPRKIGLGVQVPFKAGAQKVLVRTPFNTPSLLKTAKGISTTSKLPLVGGAFQKAAENTGRVFRPDYLRGVVGHAAEITARHHGEDLMKAYEKDMSKTFTKYRSMPEEHMVDAIDWAETNPVLKASGQAEGHLSKEALHAEMRHSPLDETQRQFLDETHSHLEKLRLHEKAMGVKYEGHVDGFYFPHLYTSTGKPLAKLTHQTARGFEKARKEGTTFKNLWEGIKSMSPEEKKAILGTEKADIISHPIGVLTARTLRSATRQASKVFTDAAVLGAGIRSKVPDAARVAKALEGISKREGHLKSVKTDEQITHELTDRYMAKHMKMSGKKLQAAYDAVKVPDIKISKVKAPALGAATEYAYKGYRVRKFGRNLWRLQDASGKHTFSSGKTREEVLGHLKQKVAQQHNIHVPAKEARYHKILSDINDRVDRDVAKNLEKHLAKRDRQADRIKRGLFGAKLEHARAMRALPNPHLEKLTPGVDYVPTQWKKQGVRVAMDPRVHEMLTRAERFVANEDSVQAFESAWGKMISFWKLTNTVATPGYRIRNTLSDYWQAFLDGVSPQKLTYYSTKGTADLLRKANAGDSAAIKELEFLADMGVLSGQTRGDVTQIAQHIVGTKGVIRRRNPVALYMHGVTSVNRYAEDAVRIGHYLAKRAAGMDRLEAVERVRISHFDYEDLTPLEQQKFKKLAPFYTWTRKNIPLQVKMLATRPGRYSAFPKFIQESENAAGGTDGDIVPQYINDSFGFKIPGIPGLTKAGYMIPQIGATDLTKLEHPDQIMQLLGPAYSAISIAKGKNPQTGQDIVGTHPRNPIANPLGLTGLLSKIPGNPLDIGPTERTINGQQQSGLGASPYLNLLLAQTSVSNIANSAASIKTSQRGAPWWLSTGGGITEKVVDPQQARTEAELQFEDQMKRILRGLRDANQLGEPNHPTSSAYQRQIQMLVQQAYGRGSY